MKILELLHTKERTSFIDSIEWKTVLFGVLKAFLYVIFFTAPLHIVSINLLIFLSLYKSIWAIVLSVLVVYFICFSFWLLDVFFLKNIEYKDDIKKDAFKFMITVASVIAVVVGIITAFEVI